MSRYSFGDASRASAQSGMHCSIAQAKYLNPRMGSEVPVGICFYPVWVARLKNDGKEWKSGHRRCFRDYESLAPQYQCQGS